MTFLSSPYVVIISTRTMFHYYHYHHETNIDIRVPRIIMKINHEPWNGRKFFFFSFWYKMLFILSDQSFFLLLLLLFFLFFFNITHLRNENYKNNVCVCVYVYFMDKKKSSVVLFHVGSGLLYIFCFVCITWTLELHGPQITGRIDGEFLSYTINLTEIFL